MTPSPYDCNSVEYDLQLRLISVDYYLNLCASLWCVCVWIILVLFAWPALSLRSSNNAYHGEVLGNTYASVRICFHIENAEQFGNAEMSSFDCTSMLIMLET